MINNLLILFLSACLGILTPSMVSAADSLMMYPRPLVVVDPGHGGSDSGTVSANQTTEKMVTMACARALASLLDSHYRVLLTRSDDYDLDLYSRTAIANAQRADIFISLHTGGDFSHQTQGIGVYYYVKNDPTADVPQPDANKPSPSSPNQPVWDQIQIKYQTDSKILAYLLAEHIHALIPDTDVQVESLPLVVLSGADLPAVLIELGYLSNFTEEKKLTDKTYLDTISQAMKNGISEYLQKNRAVR